MPPLATVPALRPLLAGALYLAFVNALTYLGFRDDKRRAAQARRRIPERRLLALAALGGTPAALYAQRALRHKTAKQPFARRLLAIAGLHLGVLAALAIAALG